VFSKWLRHASGPTSVEIWRSRSERDPNLIDFGASQKTRRRSGCRALPARGLTAPCRRANARSDQESVDETQSEPLPEIATTLGTTTRARASDGQSSGNQRNDNLTTEEKTPPAAAPRTMTAEAHWAELELRRRVGVDFHADEDFQRVRRIPSHVALHEAASVLTPTSPHKSRFGAKIRQFVPTGIAP